MQRGVTLIEALLVLGIMAILIGTVMTFYALANASYKSNQLIEEVGQLIQITQDLNRDQKTYAGMNSEILAKTGLIPNRFISSGSVVTPYGTEVQAIPFNYAGDNAPDLYLAFNFLNLPRDACEKLGTTNFSGDAQSMTVTNERSDDVDGFTPIKVVTNCQNGNNNYVNIRIEH